MYILELSVITRMICMNYCDNRLDQSKKMVRPKSILYRYIEYKTDKATEDMQKVKDKGHHL